MGLKVVESPKQLVQALSQNFRQTSSLKMEAVLSYYDEEFFETYAIVLSDDFDMERVVESLYSNIIECRKYIDKEGNFWYDTDNNYEEIYA